MSIYAILINMNKDVVIERIKDKYKKKDFHITEDGYIFVSDPGLTKEVGEKVGLVDYEGPEDKQPVGLIIKQENVLGFYYGSFWEWMNNINSPTSLGS
uniref:Uncharacterized protein n=1 Tax=Candidatus Kentrum sp. LFY TaxID=2126342 RepID=A0A450U6U0_9GAMM|nr:MAG: hypothetical protein BECKLFY1418A_GA0070994_100180 [Candidatus Kentron sp. LFY]